MRCVYLTPLEQEKLRALLSYAENDLELERLLNITRDEAERAACGEAVSLWTRDNLVAGLAHWKAEESGVAHA